MVVCGSGRKKRPLSKKRFEALTFRDDDAGVRVSPLLLNSRVLRCPAIVVSGEICDSELTYDVRHLSVQS